MEAFVQESRRPIASKSARLAPVGPVSPKGQPNQTKEKPAGIRLSEVLDVLEALLSTFETAAAVSLVRKLIRSPYSWSVALGTDDWHNLLASVEKEQRCRAKRLDISKLPKQKCDAGSVGDSQDNARRDMFDADPQPADDEDEEDDGDVEEAMNAFQQMVAPIAPPSAANSKRPQFMMRSKPVDQSKNSGCPATTNAWPADSGKLETSRQAFGRPGAAATCELPAFVPASASSSSATAGGRAGTGKNSARTGNKGTPGNRVERVLKAQASTSGLDLDIAWSSEGGTAGGFLSYSQKRNGLAWAPSLRLPNDAAVGQAHTVDALPYIFEDLAEDEPPPIKPKVSSRMEDEGWISVKPSATSLGGLHNYRKRQPLGKSLSGSAIPEDEEKELESDLQARLINQSGRLSYEERPAISSAGTARAADDFSLPSGKK
eukprot:TRINITY_DN60350_c0_g1_i1.p1 TRINITY_DN60350_c0_g1~~TRINITY_DN60350_c0_g1_i1.p1  ORF type:complete len:432 (-),score=87.81 TRINITY_DN60350_c0_g1_i1:173-1468(-)